MARRSSLKPKKKEGPKIEGLMLFKLQACISDEKSILQSNCC